MVLIILLFRYRIALVPIGSPRSLKAQSELFPSIADLSC